MYNRWKSDVPRQNIQRAFQQSTMSRNPQAAPKDVLERQAGPERRQCAGTIQRNEQQEAGIAVDPVEARNFLIGVFIWRDRLARDQTPHRIVHGPRLACEFPAGGVQKDFSFDVYQRHVSRKSRFCF